MAKGDRPARGGGLQLVFSAPTITCVGGSGLGTVASPYTGATSCLLPFGTVIQTELSPQDFADALNSGAYVGLTVVNAVPFNTYITANPSDFAAGEYDGLTVVYSPNRGFRHIIFNIDVTDFVAA